MSNTFPKYLESILKRYLKETFYAGTNRKVFTERDFGSKDLKFFAEGAKTLSGLFTSERGDLPPNYLNDKKLRAGYLLYFFPLNFCKAQTVLQKLPASLFKKSKLKILDLGSGPATFTLAFLDLLAEQSEKNEKKEISILSLDQNYHILRDAQFFHDETVKYIKGKGYAWRTSCLARTFDLRRGKPDTLLKNDQYDLIIASNFLNEWGNEQIEEKAKFLEKIYQRHLASDGFLILVDPALRHSTREMMALRDVLVARKKLHLFAPCLHAKNCPMLAVSDRDWCHFYADWKEPDFMKDLDKILKNKNEFLKYSYFIFGSKSQTPLDHLPAKQDRSTIYRAISNLMGSKGKSEIVLCGPAGRWHLTRLDKNEGAKNKVFAGLKRGDLIIAPKIPQKPFRNDGDIKLEKEDSIEKI